jgi:hypothetical protein
MKAARYRPKDEFVKTAILLTLAGDGGEVPVAASFGVQRMHGDFYVVASGEGSYAASRAEFEQTHERVGDNRWVKRATVEAYPAPHRCEVETCLADGTVEVIVTAEPGDWIVRQATGEVMVVKPPAFDARYVRDEP